ncbi:CCAAT/enhancer-binding protein zeta [Microtus ochrogaster]|uniref:CCAAT/enhancer-binding protein zeta n=1 Tax=Microtus ochrogaster TaxID=79684 RepID=A0A8J6GN64_MICOH|nr:CCAAT/enhancer-binding protein zeta [Microtus ochrogaster]
MNDEVFEIDEGGETLMDVSDDEIEEFDEVSFIDSTKKSKRKNEDNIDFAGSFQGSKQRFDDSSLLVSAEEFGHLLDENMGSKFDNSGMIAMANKDKASFKQLKWEAECDDWLHNRDVKSIIKKKKNFKKKMKIPQHSKRQRK